MRPFSTVHPAFRPAERVRAAVYRVGQQLVDGAVDRRLPDNAALLANDTDGRQRHVLLPQPQVNLADAPELRELAEHEIDRLSHAPIGILGDPVAPDLHVAHRDGEEQLAAGRLQAKRFERALAQRRELHLRQRPLHTEQQPVVRQARIVQAVIVAQQTAHKRAELQQRVPVTAVSSEPRSLQRQHDADTPFADRHQQPFEARPRRPAAGAAEILVDHHGLVPAQAAGPIRKSILTAAALVIVPQLIRRRLPDVDDRVARQVVRRDLVHRLPPSPWPSRPPCPRSGSSPLRAAAPQVSGSPPLASPASVSDPAPAGPEGSPVFPCRSPKSMWEDNDRTASRIERRSRNATSATRGRSVIVIADASGEHIQVGICANVSSGWRTTYIMVPLKRWRRTTSTRWPERGWKG